jgi:cytochrome c551/c552
MLAACNRPHAAAPDAASTSSPQSQSAMLVPAKLSDADLASKTPNQLAHHIFETHGCKNCHTLGKNERLGFNERGKQIGQNFEGCIRLLTAMNVIAQVDTKQRTQEERVKAAHFEEYGCTTCHQITPGKLGLTGYGKKLASMHLACTDVEKILSSGKGT